MNPKLQQGFSLLGLVVVIVVLGILILPNYCNYSPNAIVTEGLALTSYAKIAVAENAANGAPFNAGWVAPNATANVSTKAVPTEADRRTNVYSGIAINPANGIITITYTNKVTAAYILFWLPFVDKGIVYHNSDGTFGITDKNKDVLMSDMPTLLLLPITDNKTLPVADKPTKGVITWECHSATAPTDDALRMLLGTINPEYVPANCRKLIPKKAV
jgi:Tfp pilus assembly major pilin PilA